MADLSTVKTKRNDIVRVVDTGVPAVVVREVGIGRHRRIVCACTKSGGKSTEVSFHPAELQMIKAADQPGESK